MNFSNRFFIALIAVLLAAAGLYQFSGIFDPRFSQETDTAEFMPSETDLPNYVAGANRINLRPEVKGEGIEKGDVLKQHYRSFQYSIFSSLEDGNYTPGNESLKSLPEQIRVRMVVFRNEKIAKQQTQAFLNSRTADSNVSEIDLVEDSAVKVESTVKRYETVFVVSNRVDNIHYYVSTKTAKAEEYVSDDKAVEVAENIYTRIQSR